MIKTNRLPQGYKELEYIEGSGTQYLDLGIKADLETKAVVDYQMTDISELYAIIGASKGGNDNDTSFFIRRNVAGTAVYANFDTIARTVVQQGVNDTNRHTTIFSKDGWYIDNTLCATWSSPSSFTTPENLFLFYISGFVSAANLKIAKMKAFSCKIYENDALVRNLIPCKNPSNAVGMYDLVSKTFFANAGTGSFTAGPEKLVDVKTIKAKYNGTMQNINHIMTKVNGEMVPVFVQGSEYTEESTTIPFTSTKKVTGLSLKDYKMYGNSKQGVLPEGYTQLAYIQNTADSYILIPDMTVTNNDNFSIKFSIQSTSPSARVFSPTDGTTPYFNGSTANGTIASKYQFGMGATWINGPDLVVDEIMEVKKVGSKLTFNGIEGDKDVPAFSRPTFDLFVFRGKYSGAEKACHCRIYEFKIDGKFHLIPAQNSSNVLGMYDILNDTFYANQGTGTFTKGPTAPTPDAPVEVVSVGDKTKNLYGGTYNTKFALDNPIPANTSIKFSGDNTSSQCYVALYDSDNAEITNTRLASTQDNRRVATILPAKDVYYIKFYSSELANLCVRTDGSVEYEPYGYKIPVEISRLPSDYQEVEYLKANGNQYIDIKYSYKIDDEIECNFSVDENNGGIQGVFGNGNASSYTGTVFYINGNNVPTVTIGGILGTNFYKQDDYHLTLGQKYNVKYRHDTAYINDVKYLTVENALQNGTQDDFSLFRRWNTLALHGKIYSMAIKRNGEYIWNFVPCYRKSDNVVGMYDTVSKTFFTNNGSGNFTAGSVVANQSEVTSIYLDEPLRKIGDYADYIDFRSQKVVRNIKTRVIETRPVWDSGGSAAFSGGIALRNTTFFDDNVPSNYPAPICNYNVGYTDSRYGRLGLTRYNNTAQLHFGILYSTIGATETSTSTEISQKFNAWLKVTKPEVIYPIATPTEQSIVLPKVLTPRGMDSFDVKTTIKPSKLVVTYKGKEA